jgi:hypothetical protein
MNNTETTTTSSSSSSSGTSTANAVGAGAGGGGGGAGATTMSASSSVSASAVANTTTAEGNTDAVVIEEDNISKVLRTCPDALLQYFTTRDVRNLRVTSKAARESVAEYRWRDHTSSSSSTTSTPIMNLMKWRACFPCALSATLSSRVQWTDDDFVHLRGIHTLDMSKCTQSTITDKAFVHLRGIHTLYMSL